MRLFFLIVILLVQLLTVNGQSIDSCASDITVLKNTKDFFPIKDLGRFKAVSLCFDNLEEWRNYLWRYKSIPVYSFNSVGHRKWHESKSNDYVLLLLDGIVQYNNHKSEIDELMRTQRCILVYQGSVDEMNGIESLDKAYAIVFTKFKGGASRDVLTQFLFAALPAEGKLSASINLDYQAGTGLLIPSLHRLKYSSPENIGLEAEWIHKKVDSIANRGIEIGAFPGCRVLVAIEGHVIFNKAYGYHTYDKNRAVKQHDVYDLASVTKITGPLPLIMKAVDGGLIDLDARFSDYWKDWRRGLFHPSNKELLSFRDVLSHQARLTPYINYYPMTLRHGRYKKGYYRFYASDQYSLAIDDHLYLKTDFKKKVYKSIRKSPLLSTKVYKYSGLSFMIYPDLLSEVFEMDYETHLDTAFFKPLGASSLGYNPLDELNKNRIVPTEQDTNFRHNLSHGRVHDEAAAIMGGVSGNAGLFSSADDLAKILQMYLQKGEYGGQRYLSEKVVNEFISVQFPENDNRRGLGFDKPLFGNDTLSIDKSYPAPGVNAASFGHSGYTGTFVWMDPEHQLLYIFLSNRVYPTRDNPLIYRKNIRPSIQQVFYDAIDRRDD